MLGDAAGGKQKPAYASQVSVYSSGLLPQNSFASCLLDVSMWLNVTYSTFYATLEDGAAEEHTEERVTKDSVLGDRNT